MKPLYIDITKGTPKVTLDKENNIFEFTGRSITLDAVEFYQPVLNWFDQYSQCANEETAITFRLAYINSSSVKAILILLRKLDDMHRSHKVRINWFYPENESELQFDNIYSDFFHDMEINSIPFQDEN